MAFRISTFLTSVAKPYIDGPGNGRDAPWSISWARRAVPQTGGQNYSLASQQLPRQSLSGALNTNARRFNPLEPAPAVSSRQWPDASIGGTGITHGQVFSQPLVDPDIGGFAQSLIPINARPFNPNGIQPAGKA